MLVPVSNISVSMRLLLLMWPKTAASSSISLLICLPISARSISSWRSAASLRRWQPKSLCVSEGRRPWTRQWDMCRHQPRCSSKLAGRSSRHPPLPALLSVPVLVQGCAHGVGLLGHLLHSPALTTCGHVAEALTKCRAGALPHSARPGVPKLLPDPTTAQPLLLSLVQCRRAGLRAGRLRESATHRFHTSRLVLFCRTTSMRQMLSSCWLMRCRSRSLGCRSRAMAAGSPCRWPLCRQAANAPQDGRRPAGERRPWLNNTGGHHAPLHPPAAPSPPATPGSAW